MTGHACSECGRQRAGEPGTEHRMPCRCGAGPGPLTPDERRAAHEDHRAARTAEMAAAEDFDPLRIRPYVTLTDGGPASEDSGVYGATEAPGTYGTSETPEAYGTSETPGAYGVSAAYGAPDSSGAHGSPGPYGAYTPAGAPGAHGSSEVYGAASAGAVRPGPDEDRRRTAGAAPASGLGPDPVRPRRRRPFTAVAAGAAVAAVVVGTAAFAGGLFGGSEDRTDEALPEITTSVPDAEDEPAASVAPSPSQSASAAPSRTPSASATPSASPSASASATKTPKSTPTASAPVSASPGPGGSPAPGPGDGAPAPTPTADPPPAGIAATTLRPGDRGPQVVELQNRLRQIGAWLYSGPSDGHYTDRVAYSVAFYQSYQGVQGDPTGVYGPHTRSLLEAQTSGDRPGHR
ncbi:peptidoglycan-binding protein [Streptomyces sp. NBC_01178]|uniref:peptidoglycan-binding protein n=1 Tax=Streptomyces sp. NBC_01178 TaxID=2903762 RepID=UPI00386B6555|nr:peptidoglycan-binding protein [Streptomyces sp. NBC_01178]